MAKVMLVEDDNNLREIYEARLAAEGYEIVSAADGEAALALAIKEKPDLIISDIMMPKVSGFDMLDILRSTTETKNTKIIMMTALNQAEDKAKAEKLGADLYLVKSQVTLEDVVRSAKGLLGEETPLSVGGIPVQQPTNPVQPQTQNTTSLSANAPAVATPVATPAPAVPPVQPPAPASAPVATPAPQPAPASSPVAATPQPAPVAEPIAVTTPAPVTPAPDIAAQPTATITPSSMAQPPSTLAANTPAAGDPNADRPAGEQILVKSASADTTTTEPGIDASVSGRKKVIEPINDVFAKGPDLTALAAKEGESTTPELNTVVTPEGTTLSATNGTPTMNDVIAPQPQAQQETAPQQPLPPPVA